MTIIENYKGYDIDHRSGKGVYQAKKAGKVLYEADTKQKVKDWIDEETEARVVSTYKGQPIYWSQKQGYYIIVGERKIRGDSIRGCEKLIDRHTAEIKVIEERQTRRQEAADKVAADKEAAEAERLIREAEEQAKPPVYYDENKDSQKQEREIALERAKPTLEPVIMLEPEIVEPRPEPVKAPTEKASFIDTFIFELKSGWGKLMELIQ